MGAIGDSIKPDSSFEGWKKGLAFEGVPRDRHDNLVLTELSIADLHPSVPGQLAERGVSFQLGDLAGRRLVHARYPVRGPLRERIAKLVVFSGDIPVGCNESVCLDLIPLHQP